jgi:putative polyhydroxyalkanoate system protein
MPDLHIEREHTLGLTKARKIAWAWAEEVEQKFDMACTVIEGAEEDVVEFTRTGVSGTLRVAKDRFVLDAKLGFLLGAFAGKIKAQIEENLDTLLAAGAAKAAKKAPAAKKAAAKKTGKPGGG